MNEWELVFECGVSVGVCGSVCVCAPVNKPWRGRWGQLGLLMQGSDWGCGCANLSGVCGKVKGCSSVLQCGVSGSMFDRLGGG